MSSRKTQFNAKKIVSPLICIQHVENVQIKQISLNIFPHTTLVNEMEIGCILEE